jgi:hypothetical protein
VNDLATNTPALLTSVSTWPNCSTARSTRLAPVSGSAISPGTVSTPGSAEEVMCREFATTAYPSLR